MPKHAILGVDGKVVSGQLPTLGAMAAIADAPSDGSIYGRKNGAWTAGAGGLTLADVYPVGAVYISVVSTSPATLFGFGTWAAFGAGRVLVGLDSGDADFDTAEETGGAKTVQATAQSFSGNALASHQHDGISAGTPSGTLDDESAHTHTYTQVPNHVHAASTLFRSATTGSATTQIATTQDTSSTASTTFKTDNPDGGVATGTTAAGSAHHHHFTGDALASHQHAGVSAGTPAGTNTPGAATSVVQPYIVCYFWKRTA